MPQPWTHHRVSNRKENRTWCHHLWFCFEQQVNIYIYMKSFLIILIISTGGRFYLILHPLTAEEGERHICMGTARIAKNALLCYGTLQKCTLHTTKHKKKPYLGTSLDERKGFMLHLCTFAIPTFDRPFWFWSSNSLLQSVHRPRPDRRRENDRKETRPSSIFVFCRFSFGFQEDELSGLQKDCQRG